MTTAALAQSWSDYRADGPGRGACVAGAVAFVGAVVLAPWSPPAAAGLFCFSVAVAVALRTPCDAVTVLSVYAVVLFLVPARLVFSDLGGTATPANMMGLGAALLWVMLRSAGRLEIPSFRQPVRIVVLVFVWLSALSLAVAFARRLDPLELRSAVKGMIQAISLGGIALLVADGVADRGRLELLVRRLVMAAVAVASIGMIAFFTGTDLADRIALPGLTSLRPDHDFVFSRSTFRRVAGTAEHPIEFGLLATVALPLVLYVARSSSPGRRRRWWAAAGLLAVAMPMSLSRSAVLAMAVGALVLLPSWTPAERWRLFGASLVWAAGMKLLVPGLVGTVRSLILNAATDPSVSGRTVDFAVVGELFRSAPVFGQGLATYAPPLYPFLDNQYAKTLIEGGALGLAALVSLFVVGLATAGRARRGSADPEFRDLCQAVKASIAMVMVAFATFDGLSFDIAAGFLFVLLGLSGALWRLRRDESGGRLRDASDGDVRTPALGAAL